MSITLKNNADTPVQIEQDGAPSFILAAGEAQDIEVGDAVETLTLTPQFPKAKAAPTENAGGQGEGNGAQ